MNLPDDIYVALARGEITPEEVDHLEGFSGHLKEAAFSIPPSVRDDMIRTALNAGMLTASAGGLALAGKGLATAASALTFNRDLKAILEVHPDLKEYSEKDLKLAYTSIRTLNPEFAKDPLVGGQLLGQILRNRSPDNPKAAPRVDLGTAKDLVSARSSKKPGFAQELFGNAGFEAAKATIGERGRQRGAEATEGRAQSRAADEESNRRAAGQRAMKYLLKNPGEDEQGNPLTRADAVAELRAAKRRAMLGTYSGALGNRPTR